MSVLVKGMEMPKWCNACPLNHHSYCVILERVTDEYYGTEDFPKDCPLVEVPTPHGWLIDAEALAGEYAEYVKRSNMSDFAPTPNWNDAISLFWSAPTVIESEE